MEYLAGELGSSRRLRAREDPARAHHQRYSAQRRFTRYNVIPLTSRKPGRRIYPNETLLTSGVGGLTADSLVLCYQIRTLDERRLGRLYGKLDDLALQEQVLTSLCFQLAIAH